MNRKLAVPLAIGRVWQRDENRRSRNRILAEADQEDLRMLMALADNRVRLENLMADIERDPIFVDSEDVKSDLDFINASIKLNFLEITGELEEIESADETFDKAVA